jgi:hypothetical protein
MPSLGMQIDPRVSFQHTTRASPVHKPYGQTGNITATAHCHRSFWQKFSSLLQSSLELFKYRIPHRRRNNF